MCVYLHPFIDNMSNSPNIQIHPIVWERREQGLYMYISRCETPIDFFFFFCFGLHVPIQKTMCHDQH